MGKISLEEALAENEALKDTIAIVLAQKNDYRHKLEEVKKQLSELKEELNKPKNKVFKPKINDTYYGIIAQNGEVLQSRWNDDYIDRRRYALGNCFATEEEAKFEVEKLKVIAELKRFAEEHNEPLDWNDHLQPKFFIRYDFIQSKIIVNFDTAIMNHCIYFSSTEIAKQAVKEIGEDRIKKYYLGVEE